MRSRRPVRVRRPRWRLLAGLAGLGVGVAVFGVGLAATCRPAWYTPAVLDVGRLKSDQEDLFSLLDAIAAALNAGRSIQFELTEVQLNRWIAARAKLWPEHQLDVPGVTAPLLLLLEGNRLRVAATVSRGPVSVVLSVDARVEVAGEVVRVVPEAACVGRVPVGLAVVVAALRDGLRTAAVQLEPDVGPGMNFRNAWTWPNGRPRFRLGALEITSGKAHVSLVPLRPTP